MTDQLDGDVKACTKHVESRPMAYQLIKLQEEAGEAAAAYLGLWDDMVRPGKEATRDDVLRELADVALTALVTIERMGENGCNTLAARAAAVRARFNAPEREKIPLDDHTYKPCPEPGCMSDTGPDPFAQRCSSHLGKGTLQ